MFRGTRALVGGGVHRWRDSRWTRCRRVDLRWQPSQVCEQKPRLTNAPPGCAKNIHPMSPESDAIRIDAHAGVITPGGGGALCRRCSYKVCAYAHVLDAQPAELATDGSPGMTPPAGQPRWRRNG